MNGLQLVIDVLEGLAVRTHHGRTECHVCGAWTEAGELQHDSDCRYLAAVKLIVRVDPRLRDWS